MSKNVENKEMFLKAIDKFQAEKMKGLPICESTLPSFLSPENALIMQTVKFAFTELGWRPKK